MLILGEKARNNGYGLRQTYIRSAVTSPTTTEVFQPPDTDERFHLYAQKVTKAEPHRWIVAVTQRGGGDELVLDAHPVPDDLVEADDTPIQMLKALAETYGVPFGLGEWQGTFVESIIVPMPEDPRDAPEILDRNPNHLYRKHYIGHEEAGQFHVVLAFVIDATEVRRYLGLD